MTKSSLINAAALLISYLCFRFLANFTAPQAFALAFLLSLFVAQKDLGQKDKGQPMQRFSMSIEFRWKNIVDDHGLMWDPEAAVLGVREYDIRRGLTVTFLERSFWYAEEFARFCNLDKDLRFQIPGLTKDKYGRSTAMFFQRNGDLKSQLLTFDFGLHPPSDSLSPEPVTVVLASLPEACLNDFYGRENHPWNSAITREEADKLLKERGWTRDQESSYHYYHRYVNIWVKGL